MAITINREPGTNNQWNARNPIAFRLQTDKYVQTPEQRPYVLVSWNGTDQPVAGDLMEIAANWGFTLTLSFVAANPGANELTGYVSGTMPDYVEALAAELQQHYLLGTFFEISVMDGLPTGFYAIRLLKKDTSAIAFSGNNGNFLVSHVNYVSPAVFRPNYSFVLELYIESGYRTGQYGLAGSNNSRVANAVFKPVPNASSQADIYLERALLDHLTFDLPQLPAANELVKRCDNIQRRWWCRITDAYGDPVVTQPWGQARHRYGWAIKAGLPDDEYTPTYQGIPSSTANTVRKFMTKAPDSKEVLAGQPEWLSFRRDHADIAKVIIKAYYTDGTNSGLTGQISLSDLNAVSKADDIVMIETGYDQLNIGGFSPTKTEWKWEIYLADASNAQIFASRTYILSTKPYQHTRYFIFQNTQGGVDTVRCTGRVEKGIKIDKQTAVRPMEWDYQAPASLVMANVTGEETSYTVSTGPITKAYADYLQELVRSEYVFEYRGGAFWPVVLEPGTFTLYTEGEGIYNIQFSYRAGYEENIY